MSKIIKNTILYSIGEVLPKIVAFILLPIYTTYLSASDYGIISYTYSVSFFLLILGSLSLNSFVLRYYFLCNSVHEQKKLVGNIFLAILLVNLLILLVSFIFLPKVLHFFDVQIPWNPYFRLAVIINFLDSFSMIPLAYFRVQQKASRFISLTLGKTLIQIVFTLYFIVYKEAGLIGYFYALLCTQIPFALIYSIIICRSTILNFNFTEIKQGLKYSLPLLPGAISYFILSLSDRIILERNIDLSYIGVYNVAATIALSLNIIIQSGYKAIEPEIFKRYGTEGFTSFIKKTQSSFFALIYIAGFAISLFSQEVFYFMTSKPFHEGYRIVPILMLGVVMTGQNVIFSGILSAACKTKVIGLATICGAIFSLCFNLLFIPQFGIYAAAISSAFSFVLMNSILFIKMPFEEKSILREFFCIITMILFSGLFIFVYDPEVSIGNFLNKILLLLFYIFLVFKIMNIKSVINDLRLIHFNHYK